MKAIPSTYRSDLYSAEDILAAVRKIISTRGSQKAAAEALGFKPAYLSDVLGGRRAISEEFAARLGYEPAGLWRKATGEKSHDLDIDTWSRERDGRAFLAGLHVALKAAGAPPSCRVARKTIRGFYHRAGEGEAPRQRASVRRPGKRYGSSRHA